MATAKTNAVGLLDRLGIRYELRSYDVDPNDLAAETVAQKIGMYSRSGVQDARSQRRQARGLPGRGARQPVEAGPQCPGEDVQEKKIETVLL